jgi:FKBP-type peptidyl-prolyl cis-trans isomerase
MRHSIFLFAALSFFLFSCQSGTDTPANGTTPDQPVQPMSSDVSEDDLIARLSKEFISDPQTQLEKDINTIVNYAIDNKLNVVRTPSGLFYQITSIGNGALIQPGERVTADYQGTLLNGKVFDSSYSRGQPILFTVGNMIPGWDEGVQLMNPGSSAILLIPSSLAYGAESKSDQNGVEIIPSNSILRFDVEVKARFILPK